MRWKMIVKMSMNEWMNWNMSYQQPQHPDHKNDNEIQWYTWDIWIEKGNGYKKWRDREIDKGWVRWVWGMDGWEKKNMSFSK